jgi:hypothetical protein
VIRLTITPHAISHLRYLTSSAAGFRASIRIEPNGKARFYRADLATGISG